MHLCVPVLGAALAKAGQCDSRGRKGLHRLSYQRQRAVIECQEESQAGSDLKVQFVQVLHRHGARTPIWQIADWPTPDYWGQCRRNPKVVQSVAPSTGNSLTSDAIVDSAQGVSNSYVPCELGQLTKQGEEELTYLGSFLRRRYMDSHKSQPGIFESNIPWEEEVGVISTNTSRTILSAISLLRGLFPTMLENELVDLVQVPFPDQAKETLFANYGRCDRLRQAFHQKRSQVEQQPRYIQTQDQAFKAVGSKGWEGSTLIAVGDPLRSLRGHGLPLPQTISSELADSLDTCGHCLVDAFHGHGDDEALRLSAGLFLADMDARINAVVQGRSKLRLQILSGHDVSVGSLLLAAGLPSLRWPDFASSIHVELLKNTRSSEWYVRIAFFDGIPHPSGEATCEKTLSLSAWRQVVRKFALTEAEYLTRCELSRGEPTPPRANF